MKTFFLSFLVSSIFALRVFAGVTVEAPGFVFYKMPTGELVKRDVSLVVPAMGQGAVVLKYGDGLSVSTEHFKTRHSHGRANFIVAFTEPPGAPAGTIAVFSGSYLRGSNAAVYYGDVYGIDKGDFNTQDWENILNLDESKVPHNYVGGFGFKADITE